MSESSGAGGLGVDRAHAFDRRVGLEHAAAILVAHRGEPSGELGFGIGPHRAHHRLAVAGGEAGDEHEARDPLAEARRQRGQHDAARGVTDEHERTVGRGGDVGGKAPRRGIEAHVGDVGDAVGAPGEVDGHRTVAQAPLHLTPHPRGVARPVHEHDRRVRPGVSPAVDCTHGRDSGTAPRVNRTRRRTRRRGYGRGVDAARVNQRGILLGLAAAITFGVSAPLAKLLLDHTEPVMLAGLLYLGAFGALALGGRRDRSEARLRRADAPRVALLVAAGGVLAPVLLLLGLERVSGTSGSLLLNLEGPFTIAIGIALFGEHLSRRALLGAVFIFGGAITLGVGTGATPRRLGRHRARRRCLRVLGARQQRDAVADPPGSPHDRAPEVQRRRRLQRRPRARDR